MVWNKMKKTKKEFSYFSYMKRYKWTSFLAPFLKSIETVCELFVPLIMANIIDVGIANRNVSYIVGWSIGMVLIQVIGFGAGVLCQWVAARTGQCVGKSIRHDLYTHVNTLSHKELDKFGTSTLINRFSNDISRINNGVEIFIRLAARSPILLVGCTIMMFTIFTTELVNGFKSAVNELTSF